MQVLAFRCCGSFDGGRGIRAEFFLWWPKSHSPPLPTSGVGVRCGPGTGRQVVCVQALPVPLERDWNAVAVRLAALRDCRPPRGQITLNDDEVTGQVSGGGSFVADAGDLRMELFTRGTSRIYKCNAPRSGGPNITEPDAIEMYELLRELRRAVPRDR